MLHGLEGLGEQDQAHHCSPHFCRPDQRPAALCQEYRRYVYLLQQGLRELGCGLELRAGMEVFATAELPKLLDRQGGVDPGRFSVFAG